MAITTLDGAIAGMQPMRQFAKAVTGTMVAGRPISTWGLGGNPGAGSYDTTLNGVTRDRTTAGAIDFTNPSSGNSYLASFLGSATIAGTLILCDRIWENGGYTITSTSAQNSTTPTFGSRDNAASSNGDGYLAGVEISSATGAGTPTITLGYTNQSGTASRSATNSDATVASSAARTFYRLGLQSGDTGIRSVQSLTLSATWTSGTMNLVVYRPLKSIPITSAFVPAQLDAVTAAFARVMDSSCLFFLFVPSTTTTSNISGEVGWTQG